MANFGERVQRSVFECRLNPEQLSQLHSRLARLINEEYDQVRYYPVCSKDELRIAIDGDGIVTEDVDYHLL